MSKLMKIYSVICAVLLFSSNYDAFAADKSTKTYNCKGVSKKGITTTITIDLRKLAIPAKWDEGGPNYEFQPSFSFFVFDDKSRKKEICSAVGQSFGERDYPKPNIWSGNWWNFPLGFKAVIKNVPVDGMLNFNIGVTEMDDAPNADDYIDLGPGPDSDVVLRIYPSQNNIFVQDHFKQVEDSSYKIGFGKSERIQGDGYGDLGFATVDVAGVLELSVDMDKIRSPGLTNIGKKILPAKPEKACRNYALNAVKQNQEAQKIGCGFKPPVWSNNHQMHFDWCMRGNHVSRIGEENQKRKAALNTCRSVKAASNKTAPKKAPAQPKSPPVGDPCDLYSNEAVKLAAKAAAIGCGFSGPRWLQNYKAHYNFCAGGATPAILIAEHAAREAQYRACGGK